MKHRRGAVLGLILLFAFSVVFAQKTKPAVSALSPDALRGWLTYISSDALEGRATFSEGLALAAGYIANQLKDAGVKPAGDGGSYFQRVSVLGVRSTNRSTLTVEVNGKTRTFRDGDGITFPKNVGGMRTFTLDQVEFVGYGLNMGASHNDYAGRSPKGKAVVWLGDRAPRSVDSQDASRFMLNRASIATEEMDAAATISPPLPQFGERCIGTPNAFGNQGARAASDFTTVQRLDLPRTPNVSATADFFGFLFSGAPVSYADLAAKSERLDDLPTFTLKGVKLTFHLDADYRVVDTRYTRNVVGIVEGSDPQLRNSYVAFGGHYDHMGYAQGALSNGQTDRIWNGADDDGSGTATLIGLAQTFAAEARPKRSLLFVWHAGEECGLWGSQYFADYSTVPLDKIVAQLNIDMIGRNRDNLPSEENTVYAVGADRISTELHNVLIDADAAMSPPLKVDFSMNDPADSERIYYRSDHYSYAAKGIPIIFFFTGLHPDYHEVTDSVEKIDFPKMSRIAQLVYETGRRLANLDHPPARDFLGPRIGKGGSGKLKSTN